MKIEYVLITFVCMMLIVLLITLALETRAQAAASPPTPDTAGLAHPERAATPEQTDVIAPLFTDEDVDAVAKMLWGEARGCTLLNQQQAVWCVCNRVDDERFPDTVLAVVSQSNQFYGYDPSYPVTDELRTVAFDVLMRWSEEKQGKAVERELASGICYFTGNGSENVFREAY